MNNFHSLICHLSQTVILGSEARLLEGQSGLCRMVCIPFSDPFSPAHLVWIFLQAEKFFLPLVCCSLRLVFRSGWVTFGVALKLFPCLAARCNAMTLAEAMYIVSPGCSALRGSGQSEPPLETESSHQSPCFRNGWAWKLWGFFPIAYRWTLTTYIHLSTVLKYTFWVSVLFWKLFTLASLHLKDKYHTFHSTTVLSRSLSRKQILVAGVAF